VSPSQPDWKPVSDPKVISAAFSRFHGFVTKYRAHLAAQAKKRGEERARKAAKKKATDTGKKSNEKRPADKRKEVEVKLDQITRKGRLSLQFNQEMIVPALIILDDSKGVKRLLAQNFVQCSKTGKRRLVGLSEIDPARDLLDFQLLTKADSELEQDKVEYTLNLEAWNSTGLGVYVNFTEPMAIGRAEE
jgi:hypothetical protein